MIERPVFFNGEMIRSILQGHKTQTRRIMKNQPPEHWTPVNSLGDPDYTARTYTKEVIDRHGFLQAGPSVFGVADETWGAVSPSGMPGDRLWVRENWWQAGDSVQSYPGDDEYKWSGSRRIFYAADGTPPNEPNRYYPNGLSNGSFSAANPNRIWKKRPSIHMPRWACRILLEITAVRIERLNDISEKDCRNEGCMGGHGVIPNYQYSATPREQFSNLWQTIYGCESWKKNPWVWVVDFKLIEL